MIEKVSTEVIELTDNSEYQNDSQESRKPLEKPGVKENNIDEKEVQDADSEFSEHSPNSRMESAVKTFEIKFDKKPRKNELCLAVANLEKILKNRRQTLALK